jgi:hypothetical protein
MRIFVALILFFANELSVAQQPLNSHKSPYGSSWECDRGFRQVGNECQRVVIPANAGLDILGHDWECNRGFRRVGEVCQTVAIPKNAGLDILGHDWECLRGFQRIGSECQKLLLPANATLDVLGHDWVCVKDFKRVGSSCVALTTSEKNAVAEQNRAVQLEINRRRKQGVSGQSCEYEYKSGSNVCVTVRDTSLRCSESFSGGWFERCHAEVTFSADTDYRGGGYLDGQVSCEVSLKGSSNQGYGANKSQDEQKSITLYAFGSIRESMEFSFSFSEYDAVTNVQVRDSSCRISGVFLY